MSEERTKEEFNKKTLAYAKEIMTALEKVPADGQDAGEGQIRLDAIPAIRALVTIAAKCLDRLKGEDELIPTLFACMGTLAKGAGLEEQLNRARAMADMDDRCDVAGFTRPLHRNQYN